MKHEKRGADWAAPRIDALHSVNVESSIDVVAARQIHAVGNPTEIVERRQLANEGDAGAADAGTLNARAGQNIAWRKRPGTVVIVNAVGRGLRLEVRQVLSKQKLPMFCIDKDEISGS